jgi:glyoxylase-like metal-dependent hydrolase (beta-lactamase superfamily II)
MITELHYSATNTYVIAGKNGSLLWDTGWAGTFPLLCKALGEQKLRLQDIRYLLISHFIRITWASHRRSRKPV